MDGEVDPERDMALVWKSTDGSKIIEIC